MGKVKWFKFYPSDFMNGIANLEQIEVTAYIVVICAIYDQDGMAKRDDSVMARRCRMRKLVFTKAVDGLIAKGKLSQLDGFLTNKRASEEIENRTKVAMEKAQQRLGRDVSVTQPRLERGKKLNGFNEIGKDVRPYIEPREKKKPSFLEGSALHPASDAASAAMAGFYERQRNRGVKHN